LGANSNIEWTDHTINFWYGCKKIDTGCARCYMFRDRERFGQKGTDIVKRDYKKIGQELKKFKPGDKIFVSSWTDFFLESIPDKWRDEAWHIIQANPQFTWLILTKRPKEAIGYFCYIHGKILNVWFGVSVSTQADAERLIPELLKLPVAHRFVSVEPLLEMVDLRNYLKGLDWIIAGAESGKGMRYCDNEWLENVVKDCKKYKAPVFVKQIHIEKDLITSDSREPYFLCKDIEYFPENIKIQEYPKEFKTKIGVK